MSIFLAQPEHIGDGIRLAVIQLAAPAGEDARVLPAGALLERALPAALQAKPDEG